MVRNTLEARLVPKQSTLTESLASKEYYIRLFTTRPLSDRGEAIESRNGGSDRTLESTAAVSRRTTCQLPPTTYQPSSHLYRPVAPTMPVIQLENAFLDNLSAEEPSPSSSAISNLLDSIKLSSKYKPMPETNAKRAPAGTAAAATNKQNAQQPIFPYRADVISSPDTSQQTTKSTGMMNFTAITESL